MKYFFFLCSFVSVFGATDPVTSYLPHFTHKNGEWETTLALSNPNSTPMQVTVRVWSEAGTLLDERVIDLPTRQGISNTIDGLFPDLSEDVGWLDLLASPNLNGIMKFRSTVGQGESSLPLIREPETHLLLPLLENTEGRISGFVVTNVSDEPADLTLTLESLDGSFRQTITTQLNGKAKLKDILAGVFPGPIPPQARLQVVSSRPIAGFALTLQNGAEQIIAVPGDSWDPGVLPQLQTSIEHIFPASSIGGGTAGLSLPGSDPVVAATGYANMTNRDALTSDSVIDIGSITKSFTAALLLLLQEDGLLDLDDTIDQFSPSFPRADQITVRMLLNHTSGIADYGGNAAFFQEYLDSWGNNRNFSPADMVLAAAVLAPHFEPGAQHQYSNTNYILAGMIIELVTSDSYGNQLRTRILEPLGLNHTYLLGYEDAPNRARGYFSFPSEGIVEDLTDQENHSFFWAAGAMVSTTGDLIAWGEALFGGRLLDAASLEEMLETVPIGPFGYGLGILVGEIAGELAYFHDGSTFTGTALLFHFPEKKITAAEQFNFRIWQGASTDFMDAVFEVAGLGSSAKTHGVEWLLQDHSLPFPQ